ncbi:unnamed protein product [Protopolystoma xenopodis]|uniref:Chaperone DnaJ C-terminal domain-containing protein n=1 Tax=Protopolystoma xenopodis TaxID=117903 RepID=A0A448XN27_9PLAT|nr:unnamed protein product [Protopolystoma xenopodis]
MHRHLIFHRRGDDLHTNISISIVDALNGFSMEVSHLDGHKVKIRRDVVTWPGAILTVPGEGMPNYENNKVHGRLVIVFDVDFPKNYVFTEEQKSKVRDIFSDAKGYFKDGAKVYNGIDAVPSSQGRTVVIL